MDAESREGSCSRVVSVEASVEKEKKKRGATRSQGAVARREDEVRGVAGEV